MNRFKNIYVIILFENYRQVNIANEHHHYRSTIDDFGDFFHKLREKIDVYKFEKIIFILNRIFETTILKKKLPTPTTNLLLLRRAYYILFSASVARRNVVQFLTDIRRETVH